MAKRKHKHEEELPFVALMDTMTNVVGVLIIVLVMVGITLASSVNKVLSDLPPVTKEQYDKLKKIVSRDVPDPKKVEEEVKKSQEKITKAADELKTLDVADVSQQSKVMDPDDLRKQIEEKTKERDHRKEGVDKMIAEVDRLKALLDTTPVYQPPPATVVKLPNPREIPKNAVVQRFLVAGGHIVYLNDEEFMKTVVQEIEKNRVTLQHSREQEKDPDGRPVTVKDRSGRQTPKMKVLYDQQKISEHFTKLHIANRDLKLDVVLSPNSSRMPMRLTPAPEGGETQAQIRNPDSVFQRALRKFKFDGNTVVWFYVYKDSLDLYLNARDIADQASVAAGWEICWQNYYQRSVQPYEVNFTPPPPAPATAIRIAPPKATLD